MSTIPTLPSKSDVAILGAGPAGASLAIRLADMGFVVTLFDFPRKRRQHVGESVPASSRPMLETLGFEFEKNERAYEPRPFMHRIYWGDAPVEVSSAERSPDEASFLVWRGDFDRVLVGLARRAGVTIVEARVDSVDWETGRLRFESQDGISQDHEYRLVADCTGRSGLIARTERELGDFRTIALTAHWQSPPEHSGTLIEAFAKGWVWTMPVRAIGDGASTESCRDVTIFLDASEARPGMELDALYEDSLSRTLHASSFVHDAKRLDAVRAIDATPYGSARYQAGRFLLVGDAASFLDPLSAHGVHKALDSAFAASVAIRTLLKRPGSESIVAEFYNRRERDIVSATTKRTGYFYAAEHRFTVEPFWMDRSLTPEPIEVPPARPPLRRSMSLTPADGVRVLDQAVLHEGYVERLPVLSRGDTERAVRYWQGLVLPEIFAAASDGTSVDAAARRQPHWGFERAYRAIEWLYEHRYLESRGPAL